MQLNLGIGAVQARALRGGDTAAASVVADDPSNLQASTLLGFSYYGLNRFSEASNYLAIAAKSDPPTWNCTES